MKIGRSFVKNMVRLVPCYCFGTRQWFWRVLCLARGKFVYSKLTKMLKLFPFFEAFYPCKINDLKHLAW